MSWCDRRAALAGLALLAGCGFAPVYGPGGAAEGLRGDILVDPPSDAAGFAFVRQVERRLGPPQTPVYRLATDLRLATEGLGILPNESQSRFQVRGAATWRLFRDGEVVTSGDAAAFTGYSTTSTTVATIAARRDAIDRLMVILADDVVAALLATAPDWR